VVAELYLYLLFAAVGVVLCRGLVRPVRMYQYPFFIGGMFAAFIVPQAISLVANQGFLSDGALEGVLLMALLCLSASWFGYRFKVNRRWLERLDIPIDEARLFRCGVLFVATAYVCDYLIGGLPEEVRSSNWTGIITIYAKFATLIYLGFAILLMRVLERPSALNVVLTVFAALLPLKTIVLYGRREPAATFLLAIGLSLFFKRGYVPARATVIAVILFAALAIPLTGVYRGIASAERWDDLKELKPVEEFKKFVAEGEALELRNAAFIIESTQITGDYQYGAGYWNGLIFQLVPGQLVGRDLKDWLMTEDVYAVRERLMTVVGYHLPEGSTKSGLGDSYEQFGYFGCVFFGLVAVFFKHLWTSATRHASTVGRLFYIALIAPSLISVTHETKRFPADVLFNLVIVGAVAVYARKRERHVLRRGLAGAGVPARALKAK
jgi:hypothetical protein